MPWSLLAEASPGVGQCGDTTTELQFVSPHFAQWVEFAAISVIPAGLFTWFSKSFAPVTLIIGALISALLLTSVIDDLFNGARVLCESTKGVDDLGSALMISHVVVFFFCMLEMALRFAVGLAIEKPKPAEEPKK